MVARSLEHPVLGRLTYSEGDEAWEASAEFQPGHSIDLSLSTYTYGNPEIEAGELIQRGADYLQWARGVEASLRQRVADELLDCYNDDWASDDEEGQGTVTRGEFLSRIALDSIVLDTDGSACWYYSDGGLFAGHSIEVRVGVDRQFSEAGLAG